MHASAVIVAAGAGSRMRAAERKTYLPIGGRPMVLRTLDRVFAAETVAEVVLVVAESDVDRCRALLQSDGLLGNRAWILQSGGATRQESVRRGLDRLPEGCEIAVIHDGARPLVSAALIDRCVAEAARSGAVVAGVPVRDTIKVVADRRIQSTLTRDSLWEIQTPQAFQRDLIIEAHRRALSEKFQATDDAALVERMGRPVFVVDGDRNNIKITLPEDLLLAEALLRSGSVA